MNCRFWSTRGQSMDLPGPFSVLPTTLGSLLSPNLRRSGELRLDGVDRFREPVQSNIALSRQGSGRVRSITNTYVESSPIADLKVGL